MGLNLKDQIYRESFLESFKGLDTVSSITNMELGYLRKADNCDITEVGALVKRNGYVSILSALGVWTGRSVRFGINYKVSPTVTRKVVWGENTLNGELGYITGSAITVISSALSTNRPSIIQFDTLLFYFNGVSCFLYDGTTTRQIGITEPIAAPTFNANIAGSLVNGATYLFAYTYYNSVTGAESSPSPISAPIVPTTGGIRLNITAGVATTADTILVYRTTANGPILFLDGSTTIASTTYDSTVLDGDLGPELELDNTRITTFGQPRYALASQNRVFLTGIPDNPNRVHFSKIGINGPMPESYMATSFIDCLSAGGVNDVNLGIGQANDVPIILKPYSIGRLDQLGSTGAENGVDSVIFEYREVSRATTAVSHWAQCNVYNNLVWLGSDNIYMTDGTQIIPIGDRITDKIKRLDFTKFNNFSGHNDRQNKRIYFACDIFNLGSITTTKIVIVGSYRKFPEFHWTIYTPGRNSVTYPGIQAGCFFDLDGTSNNTLVNFGNSTYDGDIFQMNTGDNDADKGIYFDVVDYPTKMGLDEEPKLFFKDIIFARGNGGNYNLNVYGIYDLSDAPTDLAELSLLNDGAVWDISRWDIDVWAENTVRRLPYSMHRKVTYKQLNFVQSGADQPVTIFGYIKTARPEEFK